MSKSKTYDKAYGDYIPMAPEKKIDGHSKNVFVTYSLGASSGRDAWVYNYSQQSIFGRIKSMIDFYNAQIGREEPSRAPDKISWSPTLQRDWARNTEIHFEKDRISLALYRPYQKQYMYHGERLIEKPGQLGRFFPTSSTDNLVIAVNALSAKGPSCLITNLIVDSHCVGNSLCFPHHYYDVNGTPHDGISDFILDFVRKKYGKDYITKEDIFFYVYGMLHYPKYRQLIADDIEKSIPPMLFVHDFNKFRYFSHGGHQLAELHIHYEEQTDYLKIVFRRVPKGAMDVMERDGAAHDLPVGDNVSFDMLADERLAHRTAHYVVTVLDYRDNFPESDLPNMYRVEKIKFLKKGRRDTIIFNKYFTIMNVPEIAYSYVINGKSAIEWMMEQYQIKTDKESGIIDDPNAFAIERTRPDYILNLMLSVIAASVMTTEIIGGFPEI
ncbi:MAG: hypothetical protein FWG02_06855 [Holophagaceae bacterium]|nr:hypothetical protein [Holophagaceae bacterium]